MTLSEALNTNKPYRRKGEASWRPKIKTSDVFTVFDAIATDYEVEEPTITITITQLRVVVCRVMPTATDQQMHIICRELGL